MTKIISIIVPVYNEEAAIAPFFAELKNHLSYPNIEFEILFINDGSSDDTQTVLEGLARNNRKVRILEFSKNFGKEYATTAGIHHAKGDAVLSIDADLQHPPHYMKEFIKKWEDGAEIIATGPVNVK